MFVTLLYVIACFYHEMDQTPAALLAINGLSSHLIDELRRTLREELRKDYLGFDLGIFGRCLMDRTTAFIAEFALAEGIINLRHTYFAIRLNK